jgi:hypothetical protein
MNMIWRCKRDWERGTINSDAREIYKTEGEIQDWFTKGWGTDRAANESNMNELTCVRVWFETYFELVWFEIER